jgi:hypothetical protein
LGKSVLKRIYLRYRGCVLCKAVKNGPLSVHRRMYAAKCNDLLSFCCLDTVTLCLFDSCLPGMNCLDGFGIWVIVPDSTVPDWCMVNDTLGRMG